MSEKKQGAMTFEHAADTLVGVMATPSRRLVKNPLWGDERSMKMFDGALAFTYLDAFYDGTEQPWLEDSDGFDPTEWRSFHHVTVCVSNENTERHGAELMLERGTRVDRRDLRGRVVGFSNNVLRLDDCLCYRDHYLIDVPTYMGYSGSGWKEMSLPKRLALRGTGGRFRECWSGVGSRGRDPILQGNVKLLLMVARSLRKRWRVLIGFDGMPRFSFVSDPVACQELFRLRDVPPGKRRRDALITWVKEHHRKYRRDGGVMRALVRRHLRGKTVFDWRGMRVEIQPAQDDLDALRAEGLASVFNKGSVSLETP